MGTSIPLGKIFGIPLGINYSWLVIFGLVIFLMSSRFAEFYPQWPLAQRWMIAILTALLFFLSVLAHELSHSLVAVSWGIPVRGITLFIFGGVSQLAHEAQRPLSEFLVAVVGPLTSLALALVCGGLWYLFEGFSSYLSAILFTLFAVNLSLGVFNLLPGFPLDGGRVLRAGIWGLTGSYWRATQVAVRAGQGLGLLMIGAGIALTVLTVFGDFQGIWISLVGGFLFYVATSGYRQEALRESLKTCRIVEAMVSDWAPLPGQTPVASREVLEALARTGYSGVLVEEPLHGVVEGVVEGHRLATLPREAWQSATLAQVMTPLSALPTLAADTAVFDAMERMDAEGLERASVVQGGAPVGIVSRADIERLVRSRRRPRRWSITRWLRPDGSR